MWVGYLGWGAKIPQHRDRRVHITKGARIIDHKLLTERLLMVVCCGGGIARNKLRGTRPVRTASKEEERGLWAKQGEATLACAVHSVANYQIHSR